MSGYWLHRISHCQETSRPLLEKGFLTIGFSDFSNPEFLDPEEFLRYGQSDFDAEFQVQWVLCQKVDFSFGGFYME